MTLKFVFNLFLDTLPPLFFRLHEDFSYTLVVHRYSLSVRREYHRKRWKGRDNWVRCNASSSIPRIQTHTERKALASLHPTYTLILAI